MRHIRVLLVLLVILVVRPTQAQLFCAMASSGDPVQDCSSVFGGDGAPIDAQIAEVSRVVLRSLGSDDSRTGFPGNGGDITATVVAPGFQAVLTLIADGGISSGFDTGGAAGDVRLLIDQGRSVMSIEVNSSGGRHVRGGVHGDAGEVAVELRGTRVNTLTITAQGESGGRVTLLLVEGASIEQLVIDADGISIPGQITLDLEEGTRVGTVQLTPGLQGFQRFGAGAVGQLRVGETTIVDTPG
jgi:hypothetical protein